MSLDDVRLIANKYTVFGRVSPEQKQVIVETLQESGRTVAMTGDGVNDILALKVADCSIAMASGTDATKNTAHLVALDSNFGSLPKVVAEGRRVINNLQRTCTLFLTKTIFAVFMTLIFFVVGLVKITDKNFIDYPFIVNSMYLWEILTIGVGSFFLSIQPNEERLKSSFILNILKRTIPAGLVQIFIPLTFFLINLSNPNAFGEGLDSYYVAITMGIIGFSFGSIVIFVRTCYPFDKYRLGLVITIVTLFVAAIIVDKFVFYDNNLINTAVNVPGSHSLFTIEYDLITADNWWILFVVSISAVPLLFLLEYIANASVNRLAEKNDHFRGVIHEDFKGSSTSSKE